MGVMGGIVGNDEACDLHFLRLPCFFVRHAVVANEGIRQHNDLPRERGIRESFDISRHAGGKNNLSSDIHFGAKAFALEHRAVLEEEPHTSNPSTLDSLNSPSLRMICLGMGKSKNKSRAGLSLSSNRGAIKNGVYSR